MRKVNLRSVDLNLLVVLEALLDEKQVTKAAERLHMSQPAVSRALQRLRSTFSDPLLVRSTEGYDLSVRATQIIGDLKTLLQSVSHIISEPEFSPKTSKQIVKIAGPDLETALYIPDLLAVMRQEAPEMQVELDSRPADYFEMLSRGDIHFAISGLAPLIAEDQFHRVMLDVTDTALIMGEHHPLASKEITLEEYLSARHGFISITGKGPAIMDDRLREMGKTRNTVLRLSSFMSVADFCEKTDLLFMLPTNLIAKISQGRAVVTKILPPELKGEPLPFYLYWHARDHHDLMHRWIKKSIIRQAGQHSM
ncbi:LysR family transcriptional regulator [Neptunomonas antarctica]|nr:LysR family transcriptional regulator [Neptunomonas antarctica]